MPEPTHDFYAWDMLLFQTKWKCARCGKKVASYQAAKYLNGTPCFR